MKLLPLLLLLALPAVVQAQFTFTTNNGAIIITGYTGSNGMVIIPSSIKGLPVSSIGNRAFFATYITNVLISDSVINIGRDAFSHCASLTNVTIGSSVTRLGDLAFASCPKLKSVKSRGNAPRLGGGNVFHGTLTTVYFLKGTTGWRPTLGGRPTVLWNPAVPYTYITNSDGVTITITKYTGSSGAVTIPGSINFLPVTSIGNSAFYESGLNNVQIPNSVTNIGDEAFLGCTSLTNAVIPNSVVNIGDYAFSECYRLTSVMIPASVIRVGDNAFFGCNGLVNLTLANGVANIGSNAFENCSSLANIIIPGSVTNLGVAAFANCFGLTNVTILNGVNTITRDTFAFCTSLTTVTIPNSVTTIEIDAFGSCNSLTSLTIPSSVTNIWSWAFNYCPNLTGIYFYGNAPSLVGYDLFDSTPNVTVYYLPDTTGWGAMFSGRPTALWTQPTPAIRTIVFSGPVFKISWTGSPTVVVEACTNLVNPVWQPVLTNSVTGDACYFSDPQWLNYPSRFYRLRSQ